MDGSISFYYLYCINMQCPNSIFGRIKDVKLPLTIDNVLATHCCSHCDQPLTTSMEIEIEQLLAVVGIKSSSRSNYTTNK